MSFEEYFVIGIIILMVVALAKDLLRPGLVFATVLTIFITSGTISYSDALSGFSNKAMITVGILYLVSEGVRQSGALSYVASRLLPKKVWPIPRLIGLLMLPTAALSAFLNNTAVVIIFAPVVRKWAEMNKLPISKFLIPLSYATILGGLCTLMGTSTNLIVDGMMREEGYEALGMFELANVGVFVALAGIIYMVIFGNLFLPGKRITKIDEAREVKEYYFDVQVSKQGALVGKVIRNRRLKNIARFNIISATLDGVYIDLKADYTLQGEERLTIAGEAGSLTDLLDIAGIDIPYKSELLQHFSKENIQQVEVVLAPRFQGVGLTLGQYDFFKHYGAFVTAIHRNGANIVTDLKQIVLKEGDSLVLVTDDRFLESWGQSRVFYMTSFVGKYAPKVSLPKTLISVGLVVLMVLGVLFSDYLPSRPDGNKVDMFFMASVAAIVMIWARLLRAREYTKAISWDVLITIACSFGVAKALYNSGTAASIASGMITLLTSDMGEINPVFALGAIYLLTSLLTELVTNNAAAALSFPIALAVAGQLGLDPRPFFIAICVSASASFATPIGYQTNLIVQGVGNYKFMDFMKVGLPLNILCFLLSIYLIPMYWDF